MSKTPEEMAEEYRENHDECEFARDAFLAGYKAAKEEANFSTSAKWISVEDRLPEDDREVLVVLNGESYKDVHVSWHDGEDFGWATTGYVSHWMPLPAPPKEEK